MKRVLAEAGGVGRIGEPAAIIHDVGVADGEEGVALGKLVPIEQHRLSRIFIQRGVSPCRLATINSVLPAFFPVRLLVPPRAIAEGNHETSVCFPVRKHLLVKLFAQAGEVCP